MSFRLNFTTYDYDALVLQLQDIVKTKDLWKDNYAAGVGQQLIELQAYTSELMMYMIERRAVEQYLKTAALRSSVINLIELVGYVPHRCISSTGKVKFTRSPVWPNKIIIPQYTRVRTAAGVYYLTAAAQEMDGITELEVDVFQGQIATASQTGSGAASQAVELTSVDSDGNSIVENSRVWVTIDAVPWTAVDSFINSEPTDLHYIIQNNIDGTVTVLFGDGRNGKIPIYGAAIQVQYVQSVGEDGNIYAATGVITTIVDTIYDELSAVVTGITVNNSTTFVDGEDVESLDLIRYNAPKMFQAGDLAVRRSDHIAILVDYPGVASAYAWGENDLTPPDYTMMNRLFVSAVLSGWALPDTTFKNALIAYLRDFAQLTVRYEFQDAEIIEVYVADSVKVSSSFALPTVKAAVEAEIDALFVLGVVNLGIDVHYSDLMTAISDVDGVSYHNLALRLRNLVGTGDGSTTAFAKSISPLQLTRNTVKIYVDNVLEAVDDGAGVISGSGVTGTIDYTLGILSLVFYSPPALGKAIKCEYQQYPSAAQQFDLVPLSNQIFRLMSKTVTASY